MLDCRPPQERVPTIRELVKGGAFALSPQVLPHATPSYWCFGAGEVHRRQKKVLRPTAAALFHSSTGLHSGPFALHAYPSVASQTPQQTPYLRGIYHSLRELVNILVVSILAQSHARVRAYDIVVVSEGHNIKGIEAERRPRSSHGSISAGRTRYLAQTSPPWMSRRRVLAPCHQLGTAFDELRCHTDAQFGF